MPNRGRSLERARTGPAPIRFVLLACVLLGWAGACSAGSEVRTPAAEPASGPATATNHMPDDPTTPDTAASGGSRTVRYGGAPQQFGDFTPGDRDPAPVVVLVHGGFWRNPYDLTLMEPLAADLARRGYAVWNIEYRRLGDPGGGWPGTLTDVAAAVDELAVLAEEYPIDLDRVGIVGHSAGGHLALWAGGRGALDPDAPGSDPSVIPLVVIGQGAVVDLGRAAAAGLSNGATIELLGGGPADEPDRYRWATPSVAAGPTLLSVVGSADTIVPPAFSVHPRRPDAIEQIEIEGADHFDLIDPTHAAWQAVVDRLEAALVPDSPTRRSVP